jgi:hypothetical protein
LGKKISNIICISWKRKKGKFYLLFRISKTPINDRNNAPTEGGFNVNNALFRLSFSYIKRKYNRKIEKTLISP